MISRLVLAFAFMLLAWSATAQDLERRVVQGISSRVTSLDPFRLSGIDAYNVTANIVEPLARAHPKTKKLMPWLAESWTLQLHRKTFQVKLRPHVFFHNGQMLSADDVKFTFDAYRAEVAERAVWRAMWEDIESVRVVDSRTLEFKMKALNYLAFQSVMLSLRILPKSFYGAADPHRFAKEMVGSGPFQLSQFEAGGRVVLKPFARWWGSPRPDFDLIIKTVDDLKLAADFFARRELDVLALPSAANLDVFERKGPQPQSYRVWPAHSSMGEGIWLDVNLRTELFRSKAVREALLLLWDRGGMNQKLFGGRFQVALDAFSSTASFYPPGHPHAFDLSRACRLLEQAGWRDSDQDGVLDKIVEGRKIDLSFQVLVPSVEMERWVTLYQADAAKAGVRVRLLRVEPDAQFWRALKEGRFDVVAAGGGLSESVHVSAWGSGAAYNVSGYHSAEVDRQLRRLDHEFKLERRHTLERQLILRLREDVAQIPGLSSPFENYVLSNRIDLDSEEPRLAWRWRLKH